MRTVRFCEDLASRVGVPILLTPSFSTAPPTVAPK